MNLKERIEPFHEWKKREYYNLIQFIINNSNIIDSNFNFQDNLLLEDRIDIPYVSLTHIYRYGTVDMGIEVQVIEEYQQINNIVKYDRVLVSPFGLSNNLEFTLDSGKELEESPYLELRIKCEEFTSSLETIVKNFYNRFQIQPLSKEKLTRELMILNTTIKRGAWSAVELRAQSILQEFPNEPHALLALAIARAAKGDLEASKKGLETVYLFNPDENNNEQKVYSKQIRENYLEALKELQQLINIENENINVRSIIDEIKQSLNFKDNSSQINISNNTEFSNTKENELLS
ncbi:MAG: hypothetical protein FK734_01245 [Asgard group archaeon]|nr:hypothetical protein [Asgard group archaeon]